MRILLYFTKIYLKCTYLAVTVFPKCVAFDPISIQSELANAFLAVPENTNQFTIEKSYFNLRVKINTVKICFLLFSNFCVNFDF